jgi:hypothetical protein
MSRDLLKEAIADAKAVKETAIANAKAYLEEAFTPQLRSMLAAKLEEMDEEETSETVSETTDEIEEGQPADRNGDKDDDATEMEAEKDREITEEDELDLDEILNSLEEEDNSEITEEDDSLEAAVGDTERDDYEKGKEAGEEEEGDEEVEEEEIDLEDMTEDDLKSFIETVIADMVEAGELEADEEIEVEDEEIEVEDEFEVEDEVEVEISEIGDEYKTGDALNPVEKATFQEDDRTDAEEEGYEDGFKDAKSDVKDALKKMKVSEDNLEEAYDTIKTLKSELNEINLLNAKLLYTNKIFRNKALTEAQKVKILNAFDKATSVKEVKIVFETLNENIKVRTKSAIKENLGFASKATGRAPRLAAKPTVEVDPMVARFKKLAGLS